jgi:thioredoxin reductase
MASCKEHMLSRPRAERGQPPTPAGEAAAAPFARLFLLFTLYSSLFTLSSFFTLHPSHFLFTLHSFFAMPSPVNQLECDFSSVYDCVIIGGGPAGLTCAIFLGRYRRRVAVIDSGKPRNYASHGIHGFLGHHDIKPEVLLQKGRAEAESVGVQICKGSASKVEKVGDLFEVTTSLGVLRGRRAVLAYGVRDELPAIPRIEEFYGRSIFHCPDCDGYEISDKRVGVIGWGKRAAGLSLKLLQWTSQLTIFMNGHDRELEPDQTSKLLAETIAIKDEPIIELIGKDGILEAIVLSSGEHVPVDALFFNVGVERSCVLAEGVGCEVVQEAPNVVVNEYKETSVEGVYAIGDLAAGSQLAITSAADGAIAAIAINKSLLPPARLV